MPVCSWCHAEKGTDNFAFKNKEKGTRHTYCKKCKIGYSKKWYKKNKARHKQCVRLNTLQRRADRTRMIDNLKSVPCADCGNQYDPVAMDFDHLGKCPKLDNVTDLAHGLASMDRLLAEIAKCEVVCAVCHRLRTKKRKL